LNELLSHVNRTALSDTVVIKMVVVAAGSASMYVDAADKSPVDETAITAKKSFR
jgi:hypothetical protein